MLSAHLDRFAEENLPRRDLWPELVFTLPGLSYPGQVNCVRELLDRWIENGRGDAPLFVTDTGRLSYARVQRMVNRIANVLTGALGLIPGNRVLLRGANSPMLAASYLAVMKVGGIVVPTMPLLRAQELAFILDKARIGLALCEASLLPDMRRATDMAQAPCRIVPLHTDAPDGLEAQMERAADAFAAMPTGCEDVCLIAFTSGTTGTPKGTMHFHRDMLAVCDTYGAHVLRPRATDIFIGSAPIAFTFGLGGAVLFPMRIGAASVLCERTSPADFLQAIDRHRATICFTAPTAYRAMLPMLPPGGLPSLRAGVSAGETLPAATWSEWRARTGIRLMDGIGSTEMLHIFIGAPAEAMRAGALGPPVPGYEARVIDDEGAVLPPGRVGRLAVRGPTGCRYLADDRQRSYIADGWNITGDACCVDDDGYFRYQARTDDMIISAGYNIAGPEVEAALISHPAVAECGVTGVPDAARGQIVKAFIVLAQGHAPSEALVRTLREHVKSVIAPYKYPRSVAFVAALPRTESGKLQRFRLRDLAETEGSLE